MRIKDRPITLGQKAHELITTKLKIYNVEKYAQLWQWREGAKNTLNPIPAMIQTLKDIWNDKYHWCGGSWRQSDNPFNITDDTKISFLNKIYNSWVHVFRPLWCSVFFNSNICWRQSDGRGNHGHTTFKLWALTHYRSHTEWDRLNTHRHSWDSKKSIFSKHWTTSNHIYNIGDSYGCEDENVSYNAYNKSLDEQHKLDWEMENTYV